MRSTRLGIGVLGLGGIACTHHLPALRRIPGVAVVALSDPDPRARDRAARLAPGAALHDSAESLLARRRRGCGADRGAQRTSTPSVAGAAAAAGKHIYIEKPLATSAAEASRIVDAASRSGVRAAVGFNRRRHPLYIHARGVLAAGAIGRVRSVQTRLLGAGRARRDARMEALALDRRGRSPRPRLAPFRPHPLVPRHRARTAGGANRIRAIRAGLGLGRLHDLRRGRGPDAALVPGRARGPDRVLRRPRSPASRPTSRHARPSRSPQQRIRDPAGVAPPVRASLRRGTPVVSSGAAASRPTAGRWLAFAESLTQGGAGGAPSLEDGVRSLEAVLEAERLADAPERADGR